MSCEFGWNPRSFRLLSAIYNLHTLREEKADIRSIAHFCVETWSEAFVRTVCVGLGQGVNTLERSEGKHLT